MDLASKKSVDVTVWLSSGNHFFFTCNKDLHGEPDGFFDQVDTSKVTLFCNEIDGLQAVYPTTDNVNFKFLPMNCTQWRSQYPDICVEDNDSRWSPEIGPTINVLDSNSYFNITRSAVFEDMYFRGEHALAQATLKSVHPAKVPAKKCKIVTEPDGTYTAIELEPIAEALANLEYECKDIGFNDVSIPMEDEETC